MTINVSPYREAAQKIKDARDLLEPHLASLERTFRGEMRFMYYVSLERDDGAVQMSQLFRNREGRIHPANIRPGETWPFHYDGVDDWKVCSVEQRVQPEAIEAQQSLAEARRKSDALDTLTSSDLDALEDIPNRLADSMEDISRARAMFADGKEELLAAKQAVVNGGWTGSGAQAYIESLDIQVDTFDTAVSDLDNMNAAQQNFGGNVVNACVALAQILIDDRKELVEAAEAAVELITDPTSWASYAKVILMVAEDCWIAEAENLQSTLRALAAEMHSNEIVSRLADLRLDGWPTPNGRLNEPWR